MGSKYVLPYKVQACFTMRGLTINTRKTSYCFLTVSIFMVQPHFFHPAVMVTQKTIVRPILILNHSSGITSSIRCEGLPFFFMSNKTKHYSYVCSSHILSVQTSTHVPGGTTLSLFISENVDIVLLYCSSIHHSKLSASVCIASDLRDRQRRRREEKKSRNEWKRKKWKE